MITLLKIEIIALLIYLIVFIGVLMVILIPFVFLFKFYKWLTKKGYKEIGQVLIIFYFIFIVHSVYTAIYPTDGFYYEEFKRVTFRDAPESAIILRKDASYPSFMGDYCSASIMDSLNREQIIHKFSRKVKEHPNYHYYIYFFDDNKTIIINLCIT